MAQRHSNKQKTSISDEEIVAIYLFGIHQGHRTVKSIFRYATEHLKDWFPNIGKYNSYTKRLNRISDAFISIANFASRELEGRLDFDTNKLLMDSLPIVMANNKRSSKAKVAKEMADKGYCDTKKMFYHGIKLHIAAFYRENSIPVPTIIGITEAIVFRKMNLG